MFMEACKWDCCAQDSGECTCKSMEAYSRACMDAGVRLTWRKADRCRELALNSLYILSRLSLNTAYVQACFFLKVNA